MTWVIPSPQQKHALNSLLSTKIKNQTDDHLSALYFLRKWIYKIENGYHTFSKQHQDRHVTNESNTEQTIDQEGQRLLANLHT